MNEKQHLSLSGKTKPQNKLSSVWISWQIEPLYVERHITSRGPSMQQLTASLHRLNLSYALEWLVLSRKWQESMLIKPTKNPPGKDGISTFRINRFSKVVQAHLMMKTSRMCGVIQTKPYLTEDESGFNDEINDQVKMTFCRVNSTWNPVTILSLYSFQWLNGCDGNITGQELSVLYLCTCLCSMSSMAPNIFHPISPLSLFLCILCVLIGLAELTVTWPWRVHRHFVSPRNRCKLELLLTVWTVYVLWLKRGKYICELLVLCNFSFHFSWDSFITVSYQSIPRRPLTRHSASPPMCSWMIRLLPLPF